MGSVDQIKRNAEGLLKTLPEHVTLLAAAKTRTVEEVQAAFDAGIRFFGHNYVQEAQAMIAAVKFKAEWHMIGHLQRNKAGSEAVTFLTWLNRWIRCGWQMNWKSVARKRTKSLRC